MASMSPIRQAVIAVAQRIFYLFSVLFHSLEEKGRALLRMMGVSSKLRGQTSHVDNRKEPGLNDRKGFNIQIEKASFSVTTVNQLLNRQKPMEVRALTENINRVVVKMAPTICSEEGRRWMNGFKELLRKKQYPYLEELHQNLAALTALSASGLFVPQVLLEEKQELFAFNPELFAKDGGRYLATSSLLIKDGNRHHHIVPHPQGTQTAEQSLERMRSFLTKAAVADRSLEQLLQLMVTQEVMAQYYEIWMVHSLKHNLDDYASRIDFFNGGREIILELRRDESGSLQSIAFLITMKGCIKEPIEGGKAPSGMAIPLALKAQGAIHLDREKQSVAIHNEEIRFCVGR